MPRIARPAVVATNAEPQLAAKVALHLNSPLIGEPDCRSADLRLEWLRIPLPPRRRLPHSVAVKSPWSAVRARGPAAGYGLSLIALAAVIALRWLLDPVLGDTLPLVTLYGAIAAAIWLSGLAAAVTVTIVGYVIASYLFIEPRGELGLDTPATVVGFVAYLFTCALIIAFGMACAGARARSRQPRGAPRHVAKHRRRGHRDGRGRHVTYLNAAAEAVTGWTSSKPSDNRSRPSFTSSTRRRASASRTRPNARSATESSSGSRTTPC